MQGSQLVLTGSSAAGIAASAPRDSAVTPTGAGPSVRLCGTIAQPQCDVRFCVGGAAVWSFPVQHECAPAPPALHTAPPTAGRPVK